MSKQKKKSEVFQPDDRLFKTVMLEVTNARAYLKNFYPKIAARLDLDSLVRDETTFVNKGLKVFSSDIVYRCKFKNSKKGLYFSLIWENKSVVDDGVVLQIGVYLMQSLYASYKSKGKDFEPVLPLVFYNGKQNWIPKTIHALFKDHPHYDLFKPYLPTFDFLYLDITARSEEELLGIKERFFRNTMMAMANRYRPAILMKHFAVIFELEEKLEIETLFTYFAAVIRRSPKKFQEALEEMELTTKPEVMSLLEQLKAEGRIEGKAEGIAEERIKAEHKILQEKRKTLLDKLSTILRLIKMFPHLDNSELAKIAVTTLERVEVVKVALQEGNITSTSEAIQLNFFKEFELEEADLQQLKQILNEYFATQN